MNLYKIDTNIRKWLSTTLNALAFGAAVSVGLCSWSPESYAVSVDKEYRIKAALIINLFRFTHWPGEHNDDKAKLCLVGESNLDSLLPFIGQQKIRGQAITISKLDTNEVDNSCHILFIAKEAHLTRALIKQFNESAILTVGEDKNIIKQGGLVGLVRRFSNNNFTISLEINLQATQKTGIQISSDVIQLAKVVNHED